MAGRRGKVVWSLKYARKPQGQGKEFSNPLAGVLGYAPICDRSLSTCFSGRSQGAPGSLFWQKVIYVSYCFEKATTSAAQQFSFSLKAGFHCTNPTVSVSSPC